MVNGRKQSTCFAFFRCPTSVPLQRNLRRLGGHVIPWARYAANRIGDTSARTLLPLAFALLLLRHLVLMFSEAPAPDFASVLPQGPIHLSPGYPLPPPTVFSPGVIAQLQSTVVHDAMPSPSPLPLEKFSDRPDPSLYGTGDELCYIVGDSNAADVAKTSPIWQVNSRALCYERGGVCLSGKTLERIHVFSKRGSGRCEVLSVETGESREASTEEMEGSCASFRTRRMFKMYDRSGSGLESFLPNVQSLAEMAMSAKDVVLWHNYGSSNVAGSEEVGNKLAIIVPKYDWSWNICHYNRIWQNLLYIIRHLRQFIGEKDAADVRSVSILFRAKYAYDDHWTTGMRESTLPALMNETGLTVHVSKLRYDTSVDYHCFGRAILLGAEGRVDSYPFLNDTATWTKLSQLRDDHIPRIPHDALWLRSTVYRSVGLTPPGKLGSNGDYVSVPLPPLVVGHLTRSKNSKRRLDDESSDWFAETLQTLARMHGFEVREVHCSGMMPFPEQVKALHGVGLAVGIHGANLVNTLFMPSTAALFEIFPYRYVRYYYSSGANSGLRYSFHEVSNGVDYNCDSFLACMFKYRESKMALGKDDRRIIAVRLERAMRYVRGLYDHFPGGQIPLLREGNHYRFEYK